VVAALLALAAALLASLAAAPQAAAFTSAKCAGSDISGRGASFALTAHNAWNVNFRNIFCAGTPGAGVINVAYEPLGSGAGITAMTNRALPPRFGMSDDPPTPTQTAAIEEGDAGLTTDNAQLHVVPAAVGSVAVLVNFPNNCDVNLLPPGAKTPAQNLDGDATDDDVIRVRFTKAQYEAVMAGDDNADEWGEVFAELNNVANCDVAINRIVRFDNSGTTFALKDYLDTIAGGRGWLTTYQSGPNGNREWPDGADTSTFGNRDDCGDNDGTAEAADPDGPGGLADGTPVASDTDQLTSGCANGNGSLVSKLIATDSSVGYSDIATARAASPSLAITPEANDNDTYWTQVQNGSDAFTEPTADPNGFRTDGARGANCSATTFTGVPASTLDNWEPVSGVNSPAGYAICTMTYGLLFDDNADAWGTGAGEEQRARTVFDYWQSILSSGGQGLLFSNDYAPLPSNILATANAGVAVIDFNKSGTGGPPDGGGPPPDGGGPPPGGGTADNDISIGKTEISSQKGSATIEVTLPGPGVLDMDATAKVKKPNNRVALAKKTIRVGGATLNASEGGTYELTLKPKAKAKKELKRKGSLKTKVEMTFTPTGGEPNTESKSVTLKLAD
jgi:ABC-type phosphate transport system substrate-binding protein